MNQILTCEMSIRRGSPYFLPCLSWVFGCYVTIYHPWCVVLPISVSVKVGGSIPLLPLVCLLFVHVPLTQRRGEGYCVCVLWYWYGFYVSGNGLVVVVR